MILNSLKWLMVLTKTFLRFIINYRIIRGAPSAIVLKKKTPGVVQDIIDVPNPIKDSNVESKINNKI